MLALVITAIVVVLVAILAYYYHETHRKCTGSEQCRPGEGCAGYVCGKCELGNACLTSAQNAQGTSHGLDPGAFGCVNATCAPCTSNADCPGDYACDRNQRCNQICTGDSACLTGNCEKSADGTKYVCTAQCASDADCAGSGSSTCSNGSCLP